MHPASIVRRAAAAVILAISIGLPSETQGGEGYPSISAPPIASEVLTDRSAALAEIFAVEAGAHRSHPSAASARDEIWRGLAGHRAPSPEVLNAIATAALRTGVDLGLLLAAAWKESTFRPSAAASNSSARGLFQFTDRTWRESLERHGGRHGLASAAPGGRGQDAIMNLRHNPMIAALIAAESIKADGEGLAHALGRPVTQAEAFLAHFLGRSGAERFLRAVETTPHRDVRDVIPVAFANNRARFPNTAGPITVRAAHAHLMAMLESRRTLYLQLLRLELLLAAGRPTPTEMAADRNRRRAAISE